MKRVPVALWGLVWASRVVPFPLPSLGLEEFRAHTGGLTDVINVTSMEALYRRRRKEKIFIVLSSADAHTICFIEFQINGRNTDSQKRENLKEK